MVVGLGALVANGILLSRPNVPAPTVTRQQPPAQIDESEAPGRAELTETIPGLLEPQPKKSGSGSNLPESGTPLVRKFKGDTKSGVTFWWEGVPQDVRQTGLDTGPHSNIAPTDYASPQSCADCHPRNYQQWSGHAHRWMNAPTNMKTIKGDFRSGEAMHYYAGSATFLVEDGCYMMRLVRDRLRRTYQVTQTIGSRFFQDPTPPSTVCRHAPARRQRPG